jgi:hypothetical protein
MFSWEKCVEMLNILKKIYSRPGDPAVRKRFCQTGIRNLLDTWFTKKHFVQTLLKIFTIFLELANFAQIFLTARNFAQEINFLHSQEKILKLKIFNF